MQWFTETCKHGHLLRCSLWRRSHTDVTAPGRPICDPQCSTLCLYWVSSSKCLHFLKTRLSRLKTATLSCGHVPWSHECMTVCLYLLTWRTGTKWAEHMSHDFFFKTQNWSYIIVRLQSSWWPEKCHRSDNLSHKALTVQWTDAWTYLSRSRPLQATASRALHCNQCYLRQLSVCLSVVADQCTKSNPLNF